MIVKLHGSCGRAPVHSGAPGTHTHRGAQGASFAPNSHLLNATGQTQGAAQERAPWSRTQPWLEPGCTELVAVPALLPLAQPSLCNDRAGISRRHNRTSQVPSNYRLGEAGADRTRRPGTGLPPSPRAPQCRELTAPITMGHCPRRGHGKGHRVSAVRARSSCDGEQQNELGA